MGAPLIWAGNFAKFLKAQLNLSDQAYVLTSTLDPTVTATLAPPSSLYLRATPAVNITYTITDGSGSISPSTNGKYGNVFTATATAPVTAASFATSKSGVVSGNVFLKIYSVSGGLPSVVLYTSNPIAATSLPGSVAYQSFTFPSIPQLTAGVQYALIYDFSAVTGSIFVYEGTAVAGFQGVDNNGGTGDSFVTFPAPWGMTLTQVGPSSASLYQKQDAGSTTNWTLIADTRTAAGLELEMQIDDWASQGPYALWTPNIIAQASTSLVAAFTGTAALNVADSTILFGTIGDTMTSVQQLDPVEFIANPNSILADIGQADVLVYWKRGSIDTAATYQLSRDGGGTYQTITMTNAGSATDAYYGSLTFANTESLATFFSHTTGAALQVLQTGNPSQFAEKFTVPAGSAWVAQDIVLNVSSASAAPNTRNGNLYLNIVKDSAGSPSLSSTDVLVTSVAYSASAITSGADNTFAIPNTVLPAGDYWIVMFGDAAYYTGGNLVFITDASSGGHWASFNGTAWSVNSGDFKSQLQGRVLDLRLKITSGTGNAKLAAATVAYSPQLAGSTTTASNRQRFTFNSLTDTNTFTLTQFTPDPNLMVVHHVETGLTYLYGIWSLQGNTIVFPAHFFNPDGISRTVTLQASQNAGGSFNNADQNALLLAANHLGSTDATIDKSLAGFGPILRRPDGTLRMVALDNLDNITITSVP